MAGQRQKLHIASGSNSKTYILPEFNPVRLFRIHNLLLRLQITRALQQAPPEFCRTPKLYSNKYFSVFCLSLNDS